MIEQGSENPVTQVLHQEVTRVPKKVLEYLDLPPDTRVVELTRLRSVNNEPIVLVTSYLPYDLCPKVATTDFTNQSLVCFLLETECGLLITSGKRYIEAVNATESEAELLQVEPGAALILLRQCQLFAGWHTGGVLQCSPSRRPPRFEVDLVQRLGAGQPARPPGSPPDGATQSPLIIELRT